HRLPVLAGAAVLLALLGGFAGTTAGLVRAEWARQAKEAAERNELAEQGEKAQALRDKLKEEEAKNDANKGWRKTAYYNWIALAQAEYHAKDAPHSNNRPRAGEMLADEQKCPGDLRGFEWYYLKHLCHSELSSVPVGSPDKSYWEYLISPDATRVAFLEEPGTRGYVHDATTGKEVANFLIKG